MVHDLQLINKVTSSPLPPVPNPAAALIKLTPSHKHFSVIDLSNAFFCIPLDTTLQDIFPLTFRGQKLTYTRLPQDFLLSPGIFNQILKDLLLTITLPHNVVLIQYVDDLLLAAPYLPTCLKVTQQVLSYLHSVGFKVSRSKMQVARTTVSFLGQVLTVLGLLPHSTHLDSILHHPNPSTVQDMMSFLGLANYSRTFVPDFTETTGPLRQLITEAGYKNLRAPLQWTPSAEHIHSAETVPHSIMPACKARLLETFLSGCFCKGTFC